MLAKLTTKNQITLPKAATAAVEAAEYFQVETRDGSIVLTPVRLQRGDAVRQKLAELGLTADDIAAAMDWARAGVAEPRAVYAVQTPQTARKSRTAGQRAATRKPRPHSGKK